MVEKGDRVTIGIDFATDGSGWAIGSSYSPVEAVVVKPEEEVKHGDGPLLLVPFAELADNIGMTEDEAEDIYARNAVDRCGERGVKLGAVSMHHIEE